jgi:AcrR family transcriptional regulator
MPKVSEAHREARRRQIIDAAVVRAARDGFHRMTMGDLIKEAGLSAGAVYGYFPSKTALIRTISDQALGAAAQRVEELAGGPDPLSLPVVVHELVETALSTHGEHSPRIAVQVWAEAARDDEVAAMAADRLRNLRAALVLAIRRCIIDGTVAPVDDVDAMAAALLAFLLGYVVQRLLTPELSLDRYLGGISALAGATRTPQ